jgi:hypothetical protein
MSLLAGDVTLWADAGGKVKGAVTRPICGHDTVAPLGGNTIQIRAIGKVTLARSFDEHLQAILFI